MPPKCCLPLENKYFIKAGSRRTRPFWKWPGFLSYDIILLRFNRNGFLWLSSWITKPLWLQITHLIHSGNMYSTKKVMTNSGFDYELWKIFLRFNYPASLWLLFCSSAVITEPSNWVFASIMWCRLCSQSLQNDIKWPLDWFFNNFTPPEFIFRVVRRLLAQRSSVTNDNTQQQSVGHMLSLLDIKRVFNQRLKAVSLHPGWGGGGKRCFYRSGFMMEMWDFILNNSRCSSTSGGKAKPHVRL